jgi:hypothetical protein
MRTTIMDEIQFAIDSYVKDQNVCVEFLLYEEGQDEPYRTYCWRTDNDPFDAVDDLAAIIAEASDPETVEVKYEAIDPWG